MDRPDFTRPIAFALQEVPNWGRRDWAAKEIEYKSFLIAAASAIAPGDYLDRTIYTVPSGKRFYLTDVNISTQMRSLFWLRVSGGSNFFYGYLEPYESQSFSPTLPLTASYGDEIKAKTENTDVVSGLDKGIMTGWEQSASIPAQPKNDDPEELYKTGSFNFCQVYTLPDGKQIILFRKQSDKFFNYLKFASPELNYKKKLTSFKMEVKEALDIENTIISNPKAVNLLLEKYEKKYKSKRYF